VLYIIHEFQPTWPMRRGLHKTNSSQSPTTASSEIKQILSELVTQPYCGPVLMN